MNPKCIRIVVTLLLATALLGGSGCTKTQWASDIASFVAGWLARGLVPSQLTCYHNGVLVDCSTIPAEMLPAGN